MAAEKKKVNAVDALKGCTKKWLEIFRGEGMLEELQVLLGHATARSFLPRASDIFTFARHTIAAPKAVILAMDPYPAAGLAHGLAFSALSGVCPTSLARIWSVLYENKLIRSKPTATDENPRPHDLTYLAAQGVILINCALTVEPGKPGSHIRLWQPWMDKVIGRLSRALPDETIWCLWGSDAQKKADFIEPRHTILKWCHPVAMQKPSFSECDHFLTISKKFPGLVWDPLRTDTHFYTDGAAKGNQFRTTRASWGVACTRGLMADREWAGELETKTIIGPIPTKSKTGVCNAHLVRADGLADVEARPTNIRAEAAALIRAMRLALSLPAQFASVIHTDSKLWIHDMLGVGNERQGYIPNWVERGSKWTSHANADLCEEIWELYKRTEARGNIRFQFVNCWHDRPRPAEGTQDLEWWLGNRAAEEAAESALE
jgi:uracil-DNA glycosylase